MKRGILIVSLLLFVLPFAAAYDVNVGIYIINLGKFDVSSGQFTADFFLSMSCSEANCTTGSFEFMNGRATSIDKTTDLPNEKFYRIQATLTSPVDLKGFPFDRQVMQIQLEDKTRTTEEINYVADKENSGLDKSIFFPGWNIDVWHQDVIEHYYEPYNETYSQYQFNIDISRIRFNAFLKTFLPIFFIMLITIVTFVIDPDKVMNRLAIAGSSLVASVMFHVSISNQIPPVGYTTMADKFMMLTYMILLATFIINIMILELQEMKKTKLVEKINRHTEYNMLWLVPLAYIVFFLIMMR
jgi:hypothetical protein